MFFRRHEQQVTLCLQTFSSQVTFTLNQIMGSLMALNAVCLYAKVLISLWSQFSFMLNKMAHRTMGQLRD